MKRMGSGDDTSAWRDLSASERNGMLVRAEWSEDGLIALAETDFIQENARYDDVAGNICRRG